MKALGKIFEIGLWGFFGWILGKLFAIGIICYTIYALIIHYI